MTIKYIFLLAVVSQLSIKESEHASTSREILDEIVTFANKGLGIQKFEEYLKTLTYKHSPITAKNVTDLAASINSKFQNFKDDFEGMKKDIKSALGVKNTAYKPADCADVSTEHFNAVLGSNIDTEDWCVTGEIFNSATTYIPSKGFMKKWKDKYAQLNGMKYIKFGTEEGILYKYPAKHYENINRDYDPRYRPWYVETAASNPKDVVIMLDQSQSMSDVMIRAKAAAETVINTLNPNDRIGIIAFNDNVETPNSRTCYGSELAKATDMTKREMQIFINSIKTTGKTYYSKALVKAFSLFTQTKTDPYDSRQREKVILFLTDGDVTDPGDVLNTLTTENAKMNHTVVLLVFGVGGAEGSTIKNEDLLKKMAKQNMTSGSDVPAAKGRYTPIKAPNDNNIRLAMASYYNILLRGGEETVKFSVPYSDSFGTGPQISMCSAIHLNKLEGVLCIDIAIEYLLVDVIYFRDDDGAYAFIIDGQSRVLSHPLLPNVAEQSTDFFFAYMSTVEIGDKQSMDFIRENMTRGGSSSKETEWAERISSKGSASGQDVVQSRFSPTYFWHPISVANLSIAIVTTTKNKTSVQWEEDIKKPWYHTDHSKRSDNLLCKAFDRVAAKGRTAVFLSTRCFEDPHSYVYYPQNSATEQEIRSFLNGLNNNPGIKNGIRETVISLLQLESIWEYAEFSDYIIWRYFSTRSGIVVTYPGLELAKHYDATIRPWFMGAVTDNTHYFITPPYRDNWGAGTVVTLAKSISAGDKSGKYTMGVMAMDFTIQSFYYSIIKDVDLCKLHECLVIDETGYVIVHRDWIENDIMIHTNIHIVEKEPYIAEHMITEKTLQETYCIDMAKSYKQKIFWKWIENDIMINTNIHIVEKEPYIAEHMITEKTLQETYCIDMAKSYKQKIFWKVNLHSGSSNDYFDAVKIKSTNLYLIIIKKRNTRGMCQLKCSTFDNNKNCPLPPKKCHCSCSNQTQAYDHCTATLHTSIAKTTNLDTLTLPCFPRIPHVDYNTLLNQERETMKKTCFADCREYNCESYKIKQECSRVLSCKWISDRCSSQNGTLDGCSTGMAGWMIAIIVLILACVIIASIIIVICILKRGLPINNSKTLVIPDGMPYDNDYLTHSGIDNPVRITNEEMLKLDALAFEIEDIKSEPVKEDNYSTIPADSTDHLPDYQVPIHNRNQQLNQLLTNEVNSVDSIDRKYKGDSGIDTQIEFTTSPCHSTTNNFHPSEHFI